MLLGLAAAIAWWVARPVAPAASPEVPAATSRAAYVDNRQCLDCHQEQAGQWQQSHHSRAMAAPTAESVLGNFDNAEFRHRGIASRFYKRDGKFMVRTDGPDGKLADYEVAYAFGVSPLQQYLIALPGGRLQALQIAWDVEQQRWFHLLPKESARPGDVLHWTGRYQTANTMCIACHTTAYEKRYDATSGQFDSRWKEPNVSCQSCHGPGGHHVQWADSFKAGKVRPDQAGENRGLSVSLKAGDAGKQVDVCAGCHSRRSDLSALAVPGEPLLDHYLPVLLSEGLYHADGQQLDEVYVDGSYRQSKMYQKGVACSNCHNPHTGKLRADGNAVCLQCHSPQANAAFPNAAGNYDSEQHHRHKAGSAGAKCVACHMPSRTYMQIQARPDHSLRIPRPDLSSRIGAPNACNGCHADKSTQWAADSIAGWYGASSAERRKSQHYGETFAMARAGDARASAHLLALVHDQQQPAIVRASALDALRSDASSGIAERLEATRDATPAVRAAAADSYESVPGPQRLYALAPLLADPVRAVRISAARSLSSLDLGEMDAKTRLAFDAALAEFVSVQDLALDMPGANPNLAVVYENVGRADLAERHYLAALRIDPNFTPARANLAQFYNASGRNADAEGVLREGLRRMPEIGELQYSLGLLLAEEKRLPEAAQALSAAARLMPGRSKVRYSLGLALQHLGRRDAAEAALLAAQRLDPTDAAVLYALVVFYGQAGKPGQAAEWAERLRQQAPSDQRATQLLARLRAGQ
ncbi:MAG: hypothetical protein IPL03_04645 [Sterolibacteriaceae bacterium]|nr:hypothetical protein [Candidatus Methylophosphatis haderslevensis]